MSKAFLVLIIFGYIAYALLRPLAPIQPVLTMLPAVTTTAGKTLAWPSQGQAAVGINPSGVLSMHGEEQPVPIASTAKVLTALMVLKKQPLTLKQMGPKITITSADVALYSSYVAGDGSVTAVEAGETLTEYQMLQAILLPSANNIADSLAIWAFGSLQNYSTFANNYSRQIGLTHTHVGSDASGYDPSTVSTAHDLVLLGEAAIQNPVLAEIVGQTSASLPVAGTIQNVNGLLGMHDIIGVKTGNTDQAGGVFLAAQRATIAGKSLILVAAIVGTNSLFDALRSSLPLLDSAQQNFATATIAPARQVVANYVSPWGTSARAVTAQPLAAVVWQGSSVQPILNIHSVATDNKAGEQVGNVRLAESSVGPAQSVRVLLDGAIGKPSWAWRLSHPY